MRRTVMPPYSGTNNSSLIYLPSARGYVKVRRCGGLWPEMRRVSGRRSALAIVVDKFGIFVKNIHFFVPSRFHHGYLADQYWCVRRGEQLARRRSTFSLQIGSASYAAEAPL
jgi:hypothetical protein